jgi:hypothetical protein
MRFNPPPSGWTPDPSWPPAPPPALPYPADADEGVPWPSHTGRNVMVAVASAVAVVVVAVVTFVVTRNGDTADSYARPSPWALGNSAPQTDEDQIRGTLSAIEDAWNSFDYASFMSHSCAQIRHKTSNTESKFTQQRDETGTVTFTIDSISIHSATAQVEVTEKFSSQDTMSETLDFRKESDDWKLC